MKGYGFLSFARPIAGLALEQMKKPVVKEFAKTASKRALQKSAEATGDLIGNKIANKIVGNAKPETREARIAREARHSRSPEGARVEEIYIPPEKRQEIMNKLKLV